VGDRDTMVDAVARKRRGEIGKEKMNARKRKMETRRRRRNGWNTTRLSMVLAVLAVCGSCSLFSHTTKVTGGGKFWAVDASTQNSAGYHQPSSNYSLPQCPNKDTSLLCEIADPCVTTMEEKKNRSHARRRRVFVDEIRHRRQIRIWG